MKKLAIWKSQQMPTKIHPKSLFSVTKRPGKRQPSKTENFLDDNHFSLVKHHRSNCNYTPAKAKW